MFVCYFIVNRAVISTTITLEISQQWQSIIQILFSAVNSLVSVRKTTVTMNPRITKFVTIFNVFLMFFVAIGRLCEKCDGKCVICDSYVRPCTLVRICDECNYGSYQGRCVICGGPGVSDAYYCKECTIQEKDVSICERCSIT